MTSSMHADLVADAGSRPSNLIAVVELDLKGDGVLTKLAQTWAASSTGLYDGAIIESGQISRSISDDSFNLPRDSVSMTLKDDKTRKLEKIFEAYAGTISGTTANIKIASTVRGQAKWFTVFSGIFEKPSSPRHLVWQVSMRRDDRKLQRVAHIPYIKEHDWPNAPVGSFDFPAHIVYGRHSSTRTAETGMVPAIHVDTVNHRYVVSFGPIAAVNKVYVDGVRAADSDWSANLSRFVGGKYWSTIDFTAAQAEDAVVTVDCDGLTDGGVITNRATQLEHFLANFVFRDWGSTTLSSFSDWVNPSTVPIDETFFAEVESFLSDKGAEAGSRVITAGTKGIDVLQESLRQMQVPAFWTYGGKIAIRPDDHRSTSYISSPHLRPEVSPEPESRNVDYAINHLIDEVQTESLFSEASGSFQNQLTVKNPDKNYQVSEPMPLHWLESVA